MKNWLFQHIRCPFCATTLETQAVVERVADELRYGLLQCQGCREAFPVIEGIPLLFGKDERIDVLGETSDHIVIHGPHLRDLIRALHAGKTGHALSLLLNPTSLGAPSWKFDPSSSTTRSVFRTGKPASQPRGKSSLPKPRLDWLRHRYRRLRAEYRRWRLPVWRKTLSAFLRQSARDLTAVDLIDLYYETYSGAEGMSAYFRYRFGQPRHLAALCAISTLRSPAALTLDLACGAGHITHFLTYDSPGSRAVGLDRDFFRLFLAQRYIAPSCAFVCAPADRTLPFEGGTFTGAVCSDAFHYFRNKTTAALEMQRVVNDTGRLMVTRVGNREVEPHEGHELDALQYQALFAPMPTQVYGEAELLARYLSGEGLESTDQGRDLSHEKWLTVIANRGRALQTVTEALGEPAHAVGRLIVNPIYRQQARGDGGIDLYFEFPCAWYAYEDGEYQTYAPPNGSIGPNTLREIENGIRSADVRRHIDRFEVIGVPDRFCREVSVSSAHITVQKATTG